MEKDPAAVALGKRRQAKMTSAERQAFALQGSAAARSANAARAPVERQAIARRAAMTRRMHPKWITAKPAEKQEVEQGGPVSLEIPAGELAHGDTPELLAQLSRTIDELPEELLEKLASALAGRLG